MNFFHTSTFVGGPGTRLAYEQAYANVHPRSTPTMTSLTSSLPALKRQG